MPKQPETIFGERVDADLKKAFGKDVEIFNIQQKTKAGDPDRLICLKGHFLGLELKIDGGTTETIQLVKLLKIKKAGGSAYRVYPYTWSTILKELKKVYVTL